jgi:hypothetical protein
MLEFFKSKIEPNLKGFEIIVILNGAIKNKLNK